MGSRSQPSSEIVERVLADILEQIAESLESKKDSINQIISVPSQSTSSNTAMDTSAPSIPNCSFITSTKEPQITDIPIPPNISNDAGEPTKREKRRRRERNLTDTTPNVSNVAGVAGELAKKETSRIERIPIDTTPNVSNNVGEPTKKETSHKGKITPIDKTPNVFNDAEPTPQTKKRVFIRKQKLYQSELKNDPRVQRAIRAKKHRESKKIDKQKLNEEIEILKQQCKSHLALKEENLNLTKKVEKQAEKIANLEAKLETKIASQAETVEMIQYFYKVAKLLPQNAEICISSEVLKTLAPVLSDEEVEKICYDAAKNDSEAAKPTFNKRFLKMTSTIDFSTDNPQQSRPKINLLTDDA